MHDMLADSAQTKENAMPCALGTRRARMAHAIDAASIGSLEMPMPSRVENVSRASGQVACI